MEFDFLYFFTRLNLLAALLGAAGLLGLLLARLLKPDERPWLRRALIGVMLLCLPHSLWSLILRFERGGWEYRIPVALAALVAILMPLAFWLERRKKRAVVAA